MKTSLFVSSIALLLFSIHSPLKSQPAGDPPSDYYSYSENVENRVYLPQELEPMIREEMVRLDSITGFKTEVKLVEGEESTSDPNNTISLSRPQLTQIRRRFGEQQFRQMLRFLLAHEKTHQVQYRLYSVAAVRSSDEERSRIYEAQADVLAGKYLMEALGKPTPEDLVSIVDTLKISFELGAVEYMDSNHPSQEARRTAARLGMASGMITTLSTEPQNPAVTSMIGSLAEKIDLFRNESVMDWSYRVSKKITHYNRAASLDIVLEDSKIKWDESASNPFVNFTLTYKNTGQRTIHVELEVQCASVPRENSDDTLEWLKWSVKNFRFDLGPGQHYVASGRLIWHATKELMPRLVFPPRKTALMSTEYVK